MKYPQKELTILKEVKLSDNPSMTDLLKAFEEIKASYPDASADETRLYAYMSYDDIDHQNLVFERLVPNPNYESELRLYMEYQKK